MAADEGPRVMTAPGGWRVELIELDERPAWRVTQYGMTHGARAGRCFTVADVQRRLGADTFALLTDEEGSA